MVSISNLSTNIAVSNPKTNIIKQNENKQSLPDKQENKINISIKKDDVKLQSFIKGAAISSVAILAGVKFASSFSPSPNVLLGAVAVSVATGAIGASLIKGKETNFEKVVAGASIAGGIIGYVVGNKVGEGINGAFVGSITGSLVGIAAGNVLEKKTEQQK